MHVIHPIVGRPSPSVSELKERCDEPALRVLTTATRFAAWRAALLSEAHVLVSKATTGPVCTMRPPSVCVDASLTPTDLLRALLATEPDALEQLFGSDGVTDAFHQCARGWSKVATNELPKQEATTLEPAWGRLWAHYDALNGSPPFSLPTLVAALLVVDKLSDRDRSAADPLVVFHRAHAAGESTAGEAQERLWAEHFRLRGSVFDPIPPAYLDRHRGFEQLSQAIDTAPGVLLVGPDRSGKAALLRAWALDRRGKHLRGESVGQVRINPFYSFWEENESEWKQALDEDPWLLGITPDDERALDFDSYATGGDGGPWLLPAQLIERFTSWTKEGLGDVKVIAGVTPEELPILLEQAPAVSEFPRINVPVVDDLERLPIWLCHSMDKPDTQLARAITCFVTLEDNVREIVPWRLWGTVPTAWPLFEEGPPQVLDPNLKRTRRILAGRSYNGLWERIIQTFIRDVERLEALIQLDAELRGLGV